MSPGTRSSGIHPEHGFRSDSGNLEIGVTPGTRNPPCESGKPECYGRLQEPGGLCYSESTEFRVISGTRN